jgi:mono/diheme cytochrome c family protein
MKKVIVLFSIVAVSVAMVKCSPKAAKATTATTTTTTTTNTDVKPTPSLSVQTQIDAGKGIYVNKCGTCHGLKEPGMYDKGAWAHILKSMIPKAKLTGPDGDLVTAYVMANAKQD